MTYINVNVAKINDCIEKYKTYKNDCCESILTSYSLLENSDTCWNDKSSLEFRNIIKKDRLKILDYFESLDLLYYQLEKFNNDLMASLSSFGYSNQRKLSLKFDDSRIDTFNVYLVNAKDYLNNAIYIINYYLLNSNYEKKSSLYDIRSKLYSSIDIIDIIRANVKKFDTSVSNAVSTYTGNVKKINGLDIDVKNMEYSGNIVNLS